MANIQGLSGVALTITIQANGEIDMNANTSQKVGQYRYIATNIFVINKSSSAVKLDGTVSALKLQFGLKPQSNNTVAGYLLPIRTRANGSFVDTGGTAVQNNTAQPAICTQNEGGSYLYYSAGSNAVGANAQVNFEFKTASTYADSGHTVLPYKYNSDTNNTSYRYPYALPEGFDNIDSYQLLIFATYNGHSYTYNAGTIGGDNTPANNMISAPYYFTLSTTASGAVVVQPQSYFE